MLKRVSGKEWDKLVLDWEAECDEFSESFDEYAMASLPVLRDLACGAPRKDAAVFGLKTENKFDVVCQANSSLLPRYDGKVLRIRHIVLSPRFDFAMTLDEYSETLVGVFAGVLSLAYGEMASDHVKFHLKSPAERAFGEAFTAALKNHDAFTEVAMKGSWIYLSKA